MVLLVLGPARRRVASAMCVLPPETTASSTAAYNVATPPSLGLPHLGLPALGLPSLGAPTTVGGLGLVSCATGAGTTANVTCNGTSGGGSGPPSTDTTTLGGLSSSTHKWYGGVLAANGKIYGMPANAQSVLIIDPTTGSTDTTTLGGLSSSTYKWFGGVLAANGKIYGIPSHAQSVLIINPSNAPAHFVLSGCPSTCPIAQYSASTAQPCTVCPAGSVVEIGAGTGVVSANGTTCTACGAGRYSSNATTACALCPAGEYQGAIGQSSCIPCPVGSVAETGVGMGVVSSGATHCTTCPTGQSSVNATIPCSWTCVLPPRAAASSTAAYNVAT
eukprot:COSAG01_NODE_11860_length_1846_cov_1.177447_1_plen_331_part_10